MYRFLRYRVSILWSHLEIFREKWADDVIASGSMTKGPGDNSGEKKNTLLTFYRFVLFWIMLWYYILIYATHCGCQLVTWTVALTFQLWLMRHGIFTEQRAILVYLLYIYLFISETGLVFVIKKTFSNSTNNFRVRQPQFRHQVAPKSYGTDCFITSLFHSFGYEEHSFSVCVNIVAVWNVTNKICVVLLGFTVSVPFNLLGPIHWRILSLKMFFSAAAALVLGFCGIDRVLFCFVLTKCVNLASCHGAMLMKSNISLFHECSDVHFVAI